jgi:hypothetical protein
MKILEEIDRLIEQGRPIRDAGIQSGASPDWRSYGALLARWKAGFAHHNLPGPGFEPGPHVFSFGPQSAPRWLRVAARMSETKRELLEKLKFELAFVADGGYGRSVRTPHQSTSPFQDSLTCLNFGDPARPHPCAECVLMQYVPESRRGEDIPCHYIPLDGESRTIATLDAADSEEVLKGWLGREIDRLEKGN